jgi:vitellogenic carboxypeptidase-like protein
MKLNALAIACLALPGVSALHGLKQKLAPLSSPESSHSLSSPVLLTDYDSPKDAQDATAIDLPGWNGPTQHSGFLSFSGQRPEGTSSPDVNTFFWYMPSLDLNPEAPTLIWLQGGPGGSSLYGMFGEIGPMGVDANMTLFERSPAFNWNQHYSLIFLDNPCGVGFSFSPDESCYVTDQIQVGSDLTDALEVFYNYFPEVATNDLYITGESYAGKYVPAFAYTVMTRNLNGDSTVPLRGLSIGDGAMNPPAQFNNYGDLLYYMGMCDSQQRDIFKSYEKNIQQSLENGDTVAAFGYFDDMLNGDFTNGVTYYSNITQTSNYFNFQQGDCGSCEPEYYADWLVTPEIRDAIHVGDLEYSSFNETVEVYLKEDWMRGVVDMLVPLLEADDIKVLVYSGQNDIILGPPLTEQFLDALEWKGKDEYLAAERQVWKIESDTLQSKNDPIAGYVKAVEKFGFTYAVVRGAGHMAPLDQPERMYDLITSFVDEE